MHQNHYLYSMDASSFLSKLFFVTIGGVVGSSGGGFKGNLKSQLIKDKDGKNFIVWLITVIIFVLILFKVIYQEL